MKKQTVYIETTVVSYLTAKPSRDIVVSAHQRLTLEWWEKSLPFLDPFISVIVVEEVSRGDEDAAKERLEKIRNFPVLEVTDEVREIADLYFKDIPIPEKSRADTYHLALATFNGMDFLVSWNLSHILNFRVKRAVQNINLKHGIDTPMICTPEELMEV